jgi:hypothetical protein
LTLPDDAILAVAIAASGYIFQRTMRDMKGLSKKMNRIVEVLNLWADTPEKQKQAASLIVGGGK